MSPTTGHEQYPASIQNFNLYRFFTQCLDKSLFYQIKLYNKIVYLQITSSYWCGRRNKISPWGRSNSSRHQSKMSWYINIYMLSDFRLHVSTDVVEGMRFLQSGISTQGYQTQKCFGIVFTIHIYYTISLFDIFVNCTFYFIIVFLNISS